jgi:hypothetical protein
MGGVEDEASLPAFLRGGGGGVTANGVLRAEGGVVMLGDDDALPPSF